MTNRVLSIQSWVNHGYVGNKCAVFALQHLGIEIDPINTVQLSNNTAYPTWKGESLGADKLWDLYQGLQVNNLTNYSHVLTGYNNNVQSLQTVAKIVRELKEKNPQLLYICDPVLGDNNALYVPKELVPIYKQEILPLADYLFPNQTEAEFLTDMKINNEQDAIKVIDILHDQGIKNIVITSLLFNEDKENILIIGSSRCNSNEKKRFKIKVGPKFDGYYTGTGDLFSSLLLGWSIRDGGNNQLSTACEKAVSILYNIIKYTHSVKDNVDSSKVKPHYHELQLIQTRQYIENSGILFKSEPL
ncbi:pyridoxal kinase [Tieghemostelium lacteum]|uniref:pyridoxal kinase n=1 Tax=Tieghemostelium lacteum TaxID=361077 RepID=A0A151ZGD3_TIELA|nr:pyridoxal kinase [Tieghemostelium lacteum]|eukprot:KYQ93023.1 pyridoxal kinase [Tieghemostelium lacteum]